MAKIDKLSHKAKEHLDSDEEILKIIQGAYETKIMGKDSVRNGIFLATNKKLVFYAKKITGYDLEVFPYSKISSFEMGKEFLGHYISFFSSGNKAKMKWIKMKKEDVKDFVDCVNSMIGKKNEIKNSEGPSLDITEQIKKLAELKDQGVLTEEEFQSKKKDLLSRL